MHPTPRFCPVRVSILALAGLFLGAAALQAQMPVRARKEISFAAPGFQVLACDFHMHTVFSDGNVWPSVRIEEAWLDGLDAFAITDHVEYQPHKDDIPTKHGRSFDLTAPAARELGLLPIRAAEITRKLPPGHFNALFAGPIQPFEDKDWRLALQAAAGQKAFVFWNHPSFQHPKGISEWFPEHDEILSKGWMQGIEVVNGDTYYPESHRWCLEKNLTMMGNSDVHDPIAMVYGPAFGNHRPVTLVLARERTEAGIREALFERRTVVWWRQILIGRPEHLGPIFEASAEPLLKDIVVPLKGRTLVQVRNRSSVDLEIIFGQVPVEIILPTRAVLPAGRVARIEMKAKQGTKPGRGSFEIPFRVANLLVAHNEGLPVKAKVDVTFTAAQEF